LRRRQFGRRKTKHEVFVRFFVFGAYGIGVRLT
jgi:hypothetical protein